MGIEGEGNGMGVVIGRRGAAGRDGVPLEPRWQKSPQLPRAVRAGAAPPAGACGGRAPREWRVA